MALFAGWVPAVHASPIVTFANTSGPQANCQPGGADGTTCTTNTLSGIAQGDLLVFAATIQVQTSTLGTVSCTFSDGLALTLIQDVASGRVDSAGGLTSYQFIFHAVTTGATTTDTFSCVYHHSFSGADGTVELVEYDVKGGGVNQIITTPVSSGAAGNQMTATPQVPVIANSFLIVQYFEQGNCNAPGCPSTAQFTRSSSGNVAYILSYYGTDSTVTTPTSYPINGAGGSFTFWVGVAVEYSVTPGPTSQSGTLGACPLATPGTGTFLKNSTIYFYNGNALGSQVVLNVSTRINTVTGTGSQTIQLLLYVSPNQAVSAQNPYTLAFSKSFALSQGTVNSTLNLQVSVPLNAATSTPLPFNAWAVGIVGTDHVAIETSSLSGLTNQTGNPSTAAQPFTFTSIGLADTKKLSLCAKFAYQSFITSSTTTTVTTTSTTTVNGGSSNTSISYDNLMLGVIVLLGPSLLIAGVTKSLWGGVLGAVLGLAVGVFAGFLPLWTIAAVIIVSLVALIMGNRSGGGI
jgi:hypothetical protein